MGKKTVKNKTFRHRTRSYEKAKVGQSYDWVEYQWRKKIREAFDLMLEKEEKDREELEGRVQDVPGPVET